MHLQTYQAFRDAYLLTQAALDRMLHGRSTRGYRTASSRWERTWRIWAPPAPASAGASGRRGARLKALANLMSRPLGDLKLVALFIDGIEVADRTVVVPMGLDENGRKHVLGTKAPAKGCRRTQSLAD